MHPRKQLSLPRSQQVSLKGLPPKSSRQLLEHLWGEDVFRKQEALADQLCEYAEHLPQKLYMIAALAGDSFLAGGDR